MRSNHEHKSLEDESYRELRLLEEVYDTPDMSQRHLSRQLGIALGVTNVLLRSLARKGYIRIVRVKWKRWVYVLTPAGIARKVHLTFSYVERFLDHYRRVRKLLREDMGTHALDAESCVAIYGATELAELVFLVLRDLGVTNIEVIDGSSAGSIFLGMRVRSLEEVCASDYTKIFVAYQSDMHARSQELLSRGVSSYQIITLLNGSMSEPGVMEHREQLEQLG